ncbi:hypothetical protein MP228_003051 [Amoeboaphelidium protococcarum]|nr:hypothetical protein MP228_003051 [Amoeboaphelidium protococcarum]
MKSNSTGKILPDGTMILSQWNESSADKLIELQVLDKDDLYVFELSLDQLNSFKQTDIPQSEYLDSIFYALVPYSNESKPQQVVSCAINRKKESVEFKMLAESKLKIVFCSIPLQSGTLNRDIAATDPKRIQFMNTIINKVQQDLSMTVGSSQELKLIEDEVQQRRAFEFELMSKYRR